MFKNIFIDHCYNIDDKFRFHQQLRAQGFILDKQEVEHPGKAFCRFIKLKSPNNLGRFYLEFIDVRSKKHRTERSRPGLSFGYNENLEKFYGNISKKHPATFEHKNYKWKENSKERLPGWNFLSFKKSTTPKILNWFTEYEDAPFRKMVKPPKHPNGVHTFHGIVLELSKSGRKFYEKILGKKLRESNQLADGTFLYVREGRSNKFVAIVLHCNGLEKLKKFTPKAEESSFMGRDMLILDHPSNPKSMWKLWVIE